MKCAANPPDTMPERRVLVFPGGTEIAMEILASLRHTRGVKLFAAGSDVSNHASFAFEAYHPVPNVSDPAWLPAIKALCSELGINYIFPAHDDATVALIRHSGELPTVLASPQETCEICRSKARTYAALSATIEVPHVYASADEVDAFPVFVKPDCGQGSKDAVAVSSHEELRFALSRTQAPLISEYLPGEEFTIDCFSSRKGLLFAGARRRVRTRNGISMCTERVDLPEAFPLAQSIASKLTLRGAWFFQIKRRTNGELVLLEVAPRIAGAMALHRTAGVNFPLLTLLDRDDIPLQIMVNDQPRVLDRSLRNRWMHSLQFRTAYVDLDDTLIENGKVNLDLVRFLFFCINTGRRLVLLTKHAGSLTNTLQSHRLTGLFDEVIHIQNGKQKSSFITDEDCIFIDDSFSERREVAQNCGVVTLDTSMIDFVIDQAEELNATCIQREVSNVR